MNSKIGLGVASIVALGVLLSFYSYGAFPSMSEDVSELQCGFTDHFEKWLTNNNYSSWAFNRPDLKCPSYGGKDKTKDQLKHVPVVFIHGNSDLAFGRGTTDGYVSWQTGFRSLATFLTGKGYTKGQLYTTTWGPANPNAASNNTHNKAYVTRVRAFIQAVIAYTNATQINVIGHSMGVTLARKAIKGGNAIDHNGSIYNVGASLHSKVKTFVGLAGANYGLVACWTASSIPTCNGKDGFFPGSTPSAGPSAFLNEINTNTEAEGSKVYTIWSQYDDLIMYECKVWGKITCRIPGQTGQVEKTTPGFGHFNVRDDTGPDLIGWL